MSEKKITVLDLLDLDLKGQDSLNMKCIAGRSGLYREITVSDINRPGLAISGFYESFAYERVQLLEEENPLILESLNLKEISSL